MAQHDGLGSLYSGKIHRENFIDHSEQNIESRLDRVSPVDRNAAMQYLLKDLRVGHEALTFGDAPFQ